MTILVTGAGGGLGQLLCQALASRGGEDVVAVARRERADSGVLACDVTDREAVARLVARVRPRVVYHLAGSFSNEYDIDYPVNTLAARHLLEAVAASGLDARIVLMGSAAEYGVLQAGDNPVTEQQPLRPVSIYGLTKVWQTQLGLHYADAQGRDVVVARLFNLLASGLSERLFVGRVEAQIARLKRGESDRIEVGNLEASRDYVEGPQAVAQLEAIAARGERGKVYHVASGEAITMRALLHRMLDEAGVPRTVVVEGTSAAAGRKGYDVPMIRADLRRTRALMEGK